MLNELFAPELSLIEQGLEKALPMPQQAALKPLWESMHYSLCSGGKRFRPLLSLLTARALGHQPEFVLPFALAVEMIHTYSLIHDDLPVMDNDDIRRGKPTNHKVYGEAMALLAGDALLTKAFEVAASSSPKSGGVVAALAKAAGDMGMVGGQVMDIQLEKPNKEQLQTIHNLKTGALIEVSVTGSATLCEASRNQSEALKKYAAGLGFAFQLADDIQDHNSERPEEISFTTLIGVDETARLLKQVSDEARHALDGFSEDADSLRRMVNINLTRV